MQTTKQQKKNQFKFMNKYLPQEHFELSVLYFTNPTKFLKYRYHITLTRLHGTTPHNTYYIHTSEIVTQYNQSFISIPFMLKTRKKKNSFDDLIEIFKKLKAKAMSHISLYFKIWQDSLSKIMHFVINEN